MAEEEDVSSRAVPLQLIPHLARSELQPFLPSCLFLRACDVAPVRGTPRSDSRGGIGGGGGECFLVLPFCGARVGDGVGDDDGRRGKSLPGKESEGGPKEGGREAAASAKSKDYVHHHCERTAEAHTASRARSLAPSLPRRPSVLGNEGRRRRQSGRLEKRRGGTKEREQPPSPPLSRRLPVAVVVVAVVVRACI